MYQIKVYIAPGIVIIYMQQLEQAKSLQAAKILGKTPTSAADRRSGRTLRCAYCCIQR